MAHMTIPRQLGPETGPRTVLPDYSRSSATVERMVSELRRGTRGRSGTTRTVRALFPAAGTRDTVLRAVVSAALLGTTVIAVVVIVLLLGTLEPGRSPGPGLLMLLLAHGTLALLLGLLGLRFGLVALGSARSRVEISEEGLLVVGGVGSRRVDWHDVVAIESRVVHPIHWLTVALRLRDGSRVVMPAFDQHVWAYGRPSGPDVRALRRELRRRQKAAGRA